MTTAFILLLLMSNALFAYLWNRAINEREYYKSCNKATNKVLGAVMATLSPDELEALNRRIIL